MTDIPGGYIMLARKIRKSPLWLSLKSAHRMVMIEILLQAQWQDGDVVRNGEIIHLKRGQVATSYQQLVDDIGDRDVTVKIVRTAIEKLEKHNFLAKDEAKARAKKGLLLTIENYGFYQDSDNYLGKEKGNDEGDARAKSGQSEGKARAINNKDKELKEGKKGITYTPEFDEFWNVYPRKIGKAECFKTWKTVLKKGEQPSFIIQCAQNYANMCQAKGTEEQFIKHPKTFLNEERYKDFKVIVIGGNNHAESRTSAQGIRSGEYPQASGGESSILNGRTGWIGNRGKDSTADLSELQ